jgi:hypothetical protein
MRLQGLFYNPLRHFFTFPSNKFPHTEDDGTKESAGGEHCSNPEAD